MASFIDLLLHPIAVVDFADQIANQLIGWGTGSTTPDVSAGSSFPPSGSGGGNSGSGTGSGIGNCTPTGSVSLSGGMECESGSGVSTPPN
ncbi:hypothetical protein HLB23_17670 [Nocardia uniformis]|uniref:Uncharacterized protein n=1 Tax=Nocardia uniformis TaxID=53432 RepID=A0A849C734_9NOCA|nr:hypothetical protein [Nocardia uniformis]NNH71667.1 hypothetical protein [Nocardia uniformis]